MVHCNTGYCTILLYNKNVTLKGFLRRRRPTRLNYVTLVFSVFLFYDSPSTSILAYITWYTHRIVNIFNNSIPLIIYIYIYIYIMKDKMRGKIFFGGRGANQTQKTT